MDNDDDIYETPELPEPGLENTLEAVEEFNQQLKRQVDILDEKFRTIFGNHEHKLSNRVRAAKPTETGDEHIIGIIGPTGAGKSALYNALLNEECIVPTSCMQACTAAIIEVAYDRSSVDEYRALVQFVSRESWHEEIRILFRDTKNGSAEDPNKDSAEFTIALAKLSAVYPDLNRRSITTFSVDELINRPGLDFLGTSLSISSQSSHERYKELQKYVETKEKVQVPVDHSQGVLPGTLQNIEYWPLIQKVRIFVKAPVLRTGCVLVDLPGVNDVNAARAAIADDYLTKCASIWIVTPITRAVDDKIARHLLSDSFRRRLRRDGILDRVVFICSKADQLNVHELRGKFSSDAIFKTEMEEIKVHRKQFTKFENQVMNSINKAKGDLQSTLEQISSLQSEYDAYVKLLEMARDGKAVHPPILRKAKRTSTTEKSLPQKRARLDDLLSSLGEELLEIDEGDTMQLRSGDSCKTQSSGTNVIEQDTSEPAMDVSQILTKISTVEESLHEWKIKQKDRESKLAFANGKLAKLEEITSQILEQEWKACYAARNKLVSKILQDDFRHGIKDLEQAEMEDDEDFDPDAQTTDSVERHPDLPVFCTASQAFQKLRGRFADEPLSGKFTDIEQTGIPSLMRFCINIGKKEIVATRATSANHVNQLLTSVKIWLSKGDNVSVALPSGSQTLQTVTEQLIKNITNTYEKTYVKTESEVNQLNQALTRAAETGERQALGIVRAWGARPPQGYHHTTYLAIVHHGGVFVKPGRVINWIEELLSPMLRCMALRWNRALNEVIPAALNDAKDICVRLIDNYLLKLVRNNEFLAAAAQTRDCLKVQFELLKSEICLVSLRTLGAFSQDQRTTGRLFSDVVISTLAPIFAELAEDHGTGVTKRIKEKLETRIEEIKHQIFGHVALTVTHTLITSLDNSKQLTSQSLQNSFVKIRHDYKNAFERKVSSKSEASENNRASIMRTVRRIEALMGNRPSTVNTDIDVPSINGEDPVNSNTFCVKRESSSEPVKQAPPAVRYAAYSRESSVSSVKEEDD